MSIDVPPLLHRAPFAGLAPAPPVTRGTTPQRRPRHAAAVLLVALGAAILAGVIGSGLFSTVAGGQQMLDAFGPHLDRDALARYDADVATLRSGARAAQQDPALQRELAGVRQWAAASGAIDARAQGLLDRVSAAEPDYRAADAISGFDRVPLLLTALGLAAVVAGVALARGIRGGAATVAILLGLATAAYPLGSGLWAGAGSTERLVTAFEPVMREQQVVALQQDFVVIVQAVGQLDARGDRASLPPALRRLVAQWPDISSDLAGLVGTVNDERGRYEALRDLPDLALVPTGLLALGLGTTALTLAALPRRTRR